MDEKMKEALNTMENNPRKALPYTEAEGILDMMGLNSKRVQKKAKTCPWCGSRIGEDSTFSFELDGGEYATIVPVLRMYVEGTHSLLAKELKGEVSKRDACVTVPTINGSILGPPFHSISVSALSKNIADLLLGKDFDPDPCPYIGAGKCASHRVNETVTAIRKHIQEG